MKFARLLLRNLPWFAFACLLAGLFGALHNQISFTISHEYFTRFKFIQFRIPSTVPPRVGASIVGWLAAWWMGAPLATLLLPIIHRTSQPNQLTHRTTKAFAMVVVVAASASLLGLMLAMVTGDAETIEQLSRSLALERCTTSATWEQRSDAWLPSSGYSRAAMNRIEMGSPNPKHDSRIIHRKSPTAKAMDNA
jgi:hypothetical protein